MTTLAVLPYCAHYANMNRSERTVLREILRRTPGSIRALAREAGLSETLLRGVRDGDRRMTDDTRHALVRALTRWAETCDRLAEELEAAHTEGGDDA